MVSAASVKELRDQTGAGMMECKQALQKSAGNIAGAIEILRKQGIVKAAKKATRSTQEGLVAIGANREGSALAIIELNCETDFVARTDEFQNFASVLARHVAAHQPPSSATLQAQLFQGDAPKTVGEALKGVIARLGENMTIARFAWLTRQAEQQKLGSYLHAGSQIGVVVCVEGIVGDAAIKDLAMHIAAMHPLYTAPNDVPSEVAAREKEVLREAEDLKDKPEEVKTKIVDGRYRKFLAQVCLTEQIYIKDPEGKKTVGQYLKTVNPNAYLLSFLRYQVGESSRPE